MSQLFDGRFGRAGNGSSPEFVAVSELSIAVKGSAMTFSDMASAAGNADGTEMDCRALAMGVWLRCQTLLRGNNRKMKSVDVGDPNPDALDALVAPQP
jgi:hypothetical protein